MRNKVSNRRKQSQQREEVVAVPCVLRCLLFLLAMLAWAMNAGAQEAVVRVQQLGKSVASARVVMVTNVNPTVVFSNVVSRTDGRVLYRRAQNMGTTPVFYALGTTNVSTNSFHGVLAGGSAFNNGTGGTAEFSFWGGTITMLSQSGTNNVATIETKQ